MNKSEVRKIGLARALSKLGYCSRSQAVQLIRVGRVRLNGIVRRDPETPSRVPQDSIAVDGQLIDAKEKIYLVMNKPRGLVTTASDEKGRGTVYSILTNSGEHLPWVAPVGRLDKASEGLLLLTNDSEWGARIASPETHLEKSYHVQIGALADSRLLDTLVSGVKANDDDILRAKRARLLRSGEKTCWLEITIDEGKNRHIRRMLQQLDIEVLRLLRVSIGALLLGDLAKGSFRRITRLEKQSLDRAIAIKRRPRSTTQPSC